MSGPQPELFTGFFVVSLDSSAEVTLHEGKIYAGDTAEVGLHLALIADRRAEQANSKRGLTSTDPYVALEPLHLTEGRREPIVEFEVIIEGPNVVTQPRRSRFRLSSFDGAQDVEVTLRLLSPETFSEAWVQLFQKGRLLHVVVIRVGGGFPAGATARDSEQP